MSASTCHYHHSSLVMAVAVKSAVVGQISEAGLSPELQPLPTSNILMVEVDNVQHEQFTVTEEVKVRKQTLQYIV